MTASELADADFVRKNIPTFEDIPVEGAGKAYHGTTHAAAIIAAKRFLGAPVDCDLDRTQITPNSPPAIADPGVVFAYASLEEAREEGSGCVVFEIEIPRRCPLSMAKRETSVISPA